MIKKLPKFFTYRKSLTIENLSQASLDAKYAVRGAIP